MSWHSILARMILSHPCPLPSILRSAATEDRLGEGEASARFSWSEDLPVDGRKHSVQPKAASRSACRRTPRRKRESNEDLDVGAIHESRVPREICEIISRGRVLQ